MEGAHGSDNQLQGCCANKPHPCSWRVVIFYTWCGSHDRPYRKDGNLVAEGLLNRSKSLFCLQQGYVHFGSLATSLHVLFTCSEKQTMNQHKSIRISRTIFAKSALHGLLVGASSDVDRGSRICGVEEAGCALLAQCDMDN